MTLEIKLLGPPAVSRDERTIQLRGPKTLALLAYLLASGGPCPRQQLVDLLYDESADPRASLRWTLSHLRKAIGANYILSDRQVIQFNYEEAYWLDTEALTAGEPDVYRGEFLEAVYVREARRFMEWALFERERWRGQYQAMVSDQLEMAQEQGEYGRVVALGQRLLELDNLREDWQRVVMAAYARQGKREAALAQYELCRRTLDEELAVEPEPATISMAEAIEAGELGERRGSGILSIDQVPLPAFLEAGASHLAPGEPIFVGREAELNRLSATLDKALQGEGQVIFVTGEAGAGKSALVGAFARRAQDDHPQLLLALGHCSAHSGTGDPYLPFRSALAMLTGDVERAWEAGQVTTEQARRLWGALPEAGQALVDHGPGLVDHLVPARPLLRRAAATAPAGPGWLRELQKLSGREELELVENKQGQFFEQVAAFLHALSRERPLLLILDDLHWADGASLSLLNHLGRQLGGSRLLLVGAFRPEEMSQNETSQHPLRQVINELGRVHGQVTVELDAATVEMGREFVDALLDVEPNALGEDFRRKLFQRTDGQALFTVEMLRRMQERGELVKDEGGRWQEGEGLNWERLPARVEAVIGERIGRLDEGLRELLAIASVEGELFTAQVVAQVQGMRLGRLVRQLGGPLGREHKLVEEEGIQTAGGQRLLRYRFRHALFQQHLYMGLGELERQVLHQEVGEALETLYKGQEDEIAVQLAHHFQEAGLPQKALPYLLQAGEQAAKSYANEEALAAFQQALVLATGTEGYYDILARRAKVLLDIFRGREAVKEYENLLKHARQSSDKEDELEAVLGLAAANYSIALDEPDFAKQSLALYKQAYTLAGELEDRVSMVRALMATMWFTNYWPEYRQQAIINIEEAWALSKEIGDEALIIDVMIARAHYDVLSIEQVEELLIRLESRQDLPRLKEAYFRLIWRHLFSGNFTRCVDCCDASIKLAEKLGVLPAMYPTMKALGLLGLGRYEAAWKSLQEEVIDEEHPFGRALKGFGTGMFMKEVMVYREAVTIFRETIEQAEAVGRAWLSLWAQAELSKCLLRSGRSAEVNLDWTTQDLEADIALTADLPAVLGEIALAKGQLDEALRQAEKACVTAANRGWRPVYVSSLELRLRILLKLNRPEEVISLADEGIKMAEEMAYWTLLWRIRATKAQALMMLGEVETAVQEYQAAAALVRDLAATIGDVHLKRSFLSNPSVTLVIEHV